MIRRLGPLRPRPHRALRVALALGGLMAVCARAQVSIPRPRAANVPPAIPGMRATAPLRTRLWLADRKDMDVLLVGVATGKVAYADQDAPGTVQGALELNTVQRAFFELELDFGEVAQAERARDWIGVYRLLHAALTPALPYLALPDNNAVEPAMQMAVAMLRMAARTARTAADDADRARVVQQYEAAYGVLQQIARADWSPAGGVAVIKAAQCLLRMNRPKTAQFYLDEMPEPMPGDAAYGHYWLTQGLLAEHRGETRAAMDAAVLSLVFESKDIETFPDALMLSARCYEQLGEWHRARDVYFEVASLFTGTDWADDAAARLENILRDGRTTAPEVAVIENVFFGVSEDINALARTLLEERANAATNATPARREPPRE